MFHTRNWILCIFIFFLKFFNNPNQIISVEGKSQIFRYSDKKNMPLNNFICVLRTHFKGVLDVLFSYSLIKKNDVIPAFKKWISVGRNDVNYEVDRSKDISSCFQADKNRY